ncbi:hypothetical protein Rsub_05494 [Raphidocelis subcapitata]|uniref:Uncharacterized protein n=1 Tax=Raphidocelis subcapitata TaxID=307507 RepID=A0A2V0P711_9CHLO|nr:hypothetical protein Rsub_05494 [Raphidocelis subcapitata]|eukprot:GBF92875.1 hypothetical protein Rsub_05494 [Raphidocelis subcapitata]
MDGVDLSRLHHGVLPHDERHAGGAHPARPRNVPGAAGAGPVFPVPVAAGGLWRGDGHKHPQHPLLHLTGPAQLQRAACGHPQRGLQHRPDPGAPRHAAAAQPPLPRGRRGPVLPAALHPVAAFHAHHAAAHGADERSGERAAGGGAGGGCGDDPHGPGGVVADRADADRRRRGLLPGVCARCVLHDSHAAGRDQRGARRARPAAAAPNAGHHAGRMEPVPAHLGRGARGAAVCGGGARALGGGGLRRQGGFQLPPVAEELCHDRAEKGGRPGGPRRRQPRPHPGAAAGAAGGQGQAGALADSRAEDAHQRGSGPDQRAAPQQRPVRRGAHQDAGHDPLQRGLPAQHHKRDAGPRRRGDGHAAAGALQGQPVARRRVRGAPDAPPPQRQRAAGQRNRPGLPAGQVRLDEADAGAVQPGRQRVEVHARGVHPHHRHRQCRRRPSICDRHRHWDSARAAAAHFQAFRGLRRRRRGRGDGAGALPGEAVLGRDGGPHRGHQPSGAGHGLCLRAAPRGRRRRVGGLRRCGRPRRRHRRRRQRQRAEQP